MNTAEYVDALIVELKEKVANGGIPLSDAAWQAALACQGWSYVYSAWEALCTPAERRKRFKLCPDKLSIRSKCKAFDNGNCGGCEWYPGGKRTRCGDCRGFVEWIIEQITGFKLYGDTVSAQWNHKDNWVIKGQFGIDPVPQNVLVNVFIKNASGKWTHTGLYFCGATCECAVGVQHFNPMKKNRWTHWAVAKPFGNGYQPPKEPEKQPEKGQEVSNKTIRRGNYGELVKQLQTKLLDLGYDLGICGVDGDFGQATEKAVKAFQKAHGLTADGVVGPKTWAALASTTTPAKETFYTVTIPHQSKAVADEIISKYGGSMTAE